MDDAIVVNIEELSETMGHHLQRREADSIRLDSWKEIASFFNRDTRTVRRWESDRHLPVHRVPGGERSGVFAYVSELEEWLRAPNSYSASDVNRSAGRVIAAVPKPSVADPNEELETTGTLSSSDTLTSHSETSNDSTSPASKSEDIPHQPAAPVSALHLLNTYDGTFTAAVESDFAPATGHLGVSSEKLHYAGPLPAFARSNSRRIGEWMLLFAAASMGVAMVFLHSYQLRGNARAAHKPSPEAQDLYLRGRYVWNLRTEEGLTRAVDLFTQSIVNDPQFAPAYAGLADSYLLLRQYGHMPDSEAYPRALAAARQAIALDDSSPDAHRSLAFVLRFWDWDLPASEKEYRRAIALNPANSQSHHWYATALLASGRAKEALAEIDIARSLEPQSTSVLADRGIILYAVNARAGLSALEQLEHSEPAFVSTHLYLSDIYLTEGAYGKFLAETRSVADLKHDAAALAVLDRAEETLSASGNRPMLLQLAGDSAPFADRGTVPAYTVARLYSLAGKPQDALRYLRLSFDRRESYILNINRDVTLASLHSSPDFRALAKKIDGSFADEEYAARSLRRPF